jgi:glycine cleavage system H protein
MDGFSYQNIFETKGVEYIAIIIFFLMLIPFWIYLNRQEKIVQRIRKSLGILTAGILRVPQGIFFGSDHTWTHLERTGAAVVGIDDLLLHITGEVKITGTKNPGERVRKGDIIALLERDGKQLEISTPISGEILNLNRNLAERPQLLNDDPYSKGWIYKVRPENWIAETSNCYLADEATWWIDSELLRFKDFLAISTAKLDPETTKMMLQDGGELRDNTLSDLPPEVWSDFQEFFLRNPGKPDKGNRMTD